jgi:hypothetical protein
LSRKSTAAGSQRWSPCPGYSPTAQPETTLAKAEILALRVLADRLEHGEAVPTLTDLFEAA